MKSTDMFFTSLFTVLHCVSVLSTKYCEQISLKSVLHCSLSAVWQRWSGTSRHFLLVEVWHSVVLRHSCSWKQAPFAGLVLDLVRRQRRPP